MARPARWWWCCSGSTTPPQIFLLGAEFTRAWAGFHGSESAAAAMAEPVHGRGRDPEKQKAVETGHFLGGAAVAAVLMAVFRRRR